MDDMARRYPTTLETPTADMLSITVSGLFRPAYKKTFRLYEAIRQRPSRRASR